MNDQFMVWLPMGALERFLWWLSRTSAGLAYWLHKRRQRRVVIKDRSNA